MATISLVSTGIPDLLPQRERSHDIPHLSEIIYYLCITNGHIKIQPDPDMTRMQLGQAHEFALMEMYARREPDRFFRPGELRCDGIAFTPDLIDVPALSVIDIKLTWSKKANPKDLRFWKWWTQVLSYAYGIRKVTGLDIRTVEIWACYINGVVVDELDEDFPDLVTSKFNSPIMHECKMVCSREEIDSRWWDVIYPTSRSRGFLDWWYEQEERRTPCRKPSLS